MAAMTNSANTVTLSVDVILQPDAAAGFLSDAMERLDKIGWRVSKADGSFDLRVVVDRTNGCVDHPREIAPGQEGGADLRVLPAPGGHGSVVAIRPGQERDTVEWILAAELEALIQRLTQGC